MKTMVVTSEVTFVPENYDQLIVGLAENQHVAGLLVLKNWEAALFFKALGLMALGAGHVGSQLLKNKYGQSAQRRQAAYQAKGKPVWHLETINCQQALDLVTDQQIDLILNARTRYIYKKPILQAPRLGCLNIHHGILPEQRGTMCDLWALYNNEPAGFSVHAMNAKIDDGNIVETCVVDNGSETDFLSYLAHAATMELDTVNRLLDEIAATDQINGRANKRTNTAQHTRNPTRSEIKAIKRKGMIL